MLQKYRILESVTHTNYYEHIDSIYCLALDVVADPERGSVWVTRINVPSKYRRHGYGTSRQSQCDSYVSHFSNTRRYSYGVWDKEHDVDGDEVKYMSRQPKSLQNNQLAK